MLGLSLAEGKTLLKAIQAVVVKWQMQVYLTQQQPLPHCGTARRSKGSHRTAFGTGVGTFPVRSPRLYQCGCQAHATKTLGPLAELLPERTTPKWLFLASGFQDFKQPLPAGFRHWPVV
jgi:hypothetical protein